MSTLVELFSVVIPRHVLDAGYPGGTEGYLAAAARHPATRFAVADERLTSVSLASPEEVATFTEPLEPLALTASDGRTSAIACVDQHFGPVAPCPWLRWRRHEDGYTSCWLEWTEPGELAAPDGWMPERLRAAQRLEARAAASFAPPASPTAQPFEHGDGAGRHDDGSGVGNGNGAHRHEPPADRRPASLTPRDIARLEPVEVDMTARYDRMTTPVRMAAILEAPEPLELTELSVDGLETSEAWRAEPAELPVVQDVVTDVVAAYVVDVEPVVEPVVEPAADPVAEPVTDAARADDPSEEVPEMAADFEASPWSAPMVEVLDEEVRGVEAMYDEPAEVVDAVDAAPLDGLMATASFEATLSAVPPVAATLDEPAVVDEPLAEPPVAEPEAVAEPEPVTFAHALDAAFAEAAAEAREAEAVAEAVAEAAAGDEALPDIAAIETARERSWHGDAESVAPGATAAFMAAVEREVEELFASPARGRAAPLTAPYAGTPHVDRHPTLTPQPEAASSMSALSLSVAPPHDADAAAAQPMLDELRQMLRDKGWRYSHDPEHSALFFQVTGARASYPGCAAVDEQNRLVWLYTQFPVRIPEARRPAAVELLTRANHGLPVGNFEFDYRDGEVRFKAYADGGEGCFSAAQASRMLRASLAACDRYHDALMSVIYGGATATEAYEAARNG